MNFLAHVHLASHSDEAMVGAFLGDFVAPTATTSLGPTVVSEIALHREVDRFTDSHAVVRQTRQLCAPANRLFARIALDVYYDHFLTKHWSRHSTRSLDAVVERFYTAISRRSALLPERARQVSAAMVKKDWLRSYTSDDRVSHAVSTIALRLSRKREHLLAAMAELRQQREDVEAGFAQFYPQLREFVAQRRWQHSNRLFTSALPSSADVTQARPL